VGDTVSPSSTGLLVAVGAAPFEAELLAASEHGTLHVVRRCVDVADLLATASARQATVAVVSAQLRGLDTTVVARLRREGVAVLGMTVEPESADEARLRELGVADVADAGQLHQFASLVADLTDAEHQTVESEPWHAGDEGTGAEGSASGGRVVAVWGPSGAPGRSTVAAALAATAADLGHRTLLVDADVYGGTIAPMLGLLDEASGLLAAARAANHGELRPDVLVRQARAVHPTLRVLTGLPRADRWVEVGSVLMRRILDTAGTVSDVTVVDTGFSLELDEELSYDTAAPRRNGATLEVLARADLVVAVGGADPVSLSRLVRGIHDLRTAVPGISPRVVVNRVRSSLGWSEHEMAEMIARATGLGVTATLPDDPAACDRALVTGTTLLESAPDSRLVRRVRSLTGDLLGVREPVRRRRAGRVR
jgi:Mrp family chromosome partitioning ATPase